MRRLLLVTTLASCTMPTRVTTDAVAKDATPPIDRSLEFFASRPLLERPLDAGNKPVHGIPDNRAATCGQCHPDHYAEWSVSTHRHAWHDPQFQAETAKSGNLWLCRNCHTPALTQQKQWPIGLRNNDVEKPILVDNPDYDPAFEDEGITCAACHVRDGVIHGPGLSDSAPPHPAKADAAYRTEQLCVRCHQAVATYPGKSFVCTFQTEEEWRAGPAFTEGKTCVHCHMAEVQEPVAVGGPVRTRHRHWFAGSGIPKVKGSAPPLDAPPGRGLALEASPSADTLTITLSNVTGHALPTGDPERWIQVRAVFVDADNTAVGEPWTTRLGQEWEWHPAPRKLGDTRLTAGERRKVEIKVPANARRAHLTAESHRMSKANAAYHHLDDYPLSIGTHDQWVDLPR